MNDEILIRYINKHCTATEEKEILEWLKEKDNRQRLFELEQIWGLKAEMRFSDKGRMDEAYRQLSRQLCLSGQIEKREKPIQRFTVREWWKYAAVLVAVCLFATNLFYITKEEPEAYNTVVVPKGQRVSLLLSDGTTVWLNAESRFSYPAKFSEKYRTVTLEGEGYFEVAHNPKCPFTVKLPMLNIRVLGTKFNFKTPSNGRIVETSLIEGEIKVSGNNNEGAITLSPGQKVELNTVTKQMKVSETNAALDAIWHNNLIPFKNADIFDIAEVLEKVYGVKIILSPDISPSTTYSGVLKRKDSIEDVLRILQNTIHLQYKIHQETIFISSASK